MHSADARLRSAAPTASTVLFVAFALLAGSAAASPGTVADQRVVVAEQDVYAATGSCHWWHHARRECLHQRNHKHGDPHWLRAHFGHRESFLRFALPRQERTTEAWLRLTVHAQRGDTVVRLVGDNSWAEGSLTFERKPGVGREVCVIPHAAPWDSPFMVSAPARLRRRGVTTDGAARGAVQRDGPRQ